MNQHTNLDPADQTSDWFKKITAVKAVSILQKSNTLLRAKLEAMTSLIKKSSTGRELETIMKRNAFLEGKTMQQADNISQQKDRIQDLKFNNTRIKTGSDNINRFLNALKDG